MLRSLGASARLGRFAVGTGWRYLATCLDLRRAADAPDRLERAQRRTRAWGQATARALGVEVDVRGALPDGPALLTPNHLGYLDVIGLAVASGALFVSKADVQRWPLLGRLFHGTEHMTIDRASRMGLRDARARVGAKLRAGARVVVFPEGTSSAGDAVLPFKPGLFQAALDAGVPVIPVSLRYHAGRSQLDPAEQLAYWRPEHTFAPHLWEVLRHPGARIEVTFGAPQRGHGDRRALAEATHAAVRRLRGEAARAAA